MRWFGVVFGSFFCAVLAATLSLWSMSMVSEMFQPVPNFPIDLFTAKVFLLVAAGIASVAAIPALIACRWLEAAGRSPSSRTYALAGMATGGLVSLGWSILPLLGHLSKAWAWKHFFSQLYLCAAFAIAGLVAGWVFGEVRKQFVP
ncbi:MAG: hypothetical protein Q8S09_06125 [Hyphomonas sp.]|nr:hypothetical protein [Hyphomonas sp.]